MVATKITLEQLSRRVKLLPQQMTKAVVRGLQASGQRLQVMVVEEIQGADPYPAVNMGDLLRSVHTDFVHDGAEVIVDAPHAAHMEYGTRPHFPPVAPLKEWVMQKGISGDEEEAWGIALAIARNMAIWGIEPRNYMANAMARLEQDDVISQEVAREMARIARHPFRRLG